MVIAGASSLELPEKERATAMSLRAPGNKWYPRIINPPGRCHSIQRQWTCLWLGSPWKDRYSCRFVQKFGRYLPILQEARQILACNMSITFVLAVGIVTAGGYWAGAIEEKRQQFIKYNCKKPEDFEHTAINSGIFCIWKSIATLLLYLVYALLILWSFIVFNYRIILHICTIWALQLSVSFFEQTPIWRAESMFTVSSQRLGSEETVPSRAQHLHYCLLDGLQKWGTMGLDSARC